VSQTCLTDWNASGLSSLLIQSLFCTILGLRTSGLLRTLQISCILFRYMQYWLSYSQDWKHLWTLVVFPKKGVWPLVCKQKSNSTSLLKLAANEIENEIKSKSNPNQSWILHFDWPHCSLHLHFVSDLHMLQHVGQCKHADLLGLPVNIRVVLMELGVQWAIAQLQTGCTEHDHCTGG